MLYRGRERRAVLVHTYLGMRVRARFVRFPEIDQYLLEGGCMLEKAGQLARRLREMIDTWVGSAEGWAELNG